MNLIIITWSFWQNHSTFPFIIVFEVELHFSLKSKLSSHPMLCPTQYEAHNSNLLYQLKRINMSKHRASHDIEVLVFCPEIHVWRERYWVLFWAVCASARPGKTIPALNNREKERERERERRGRRSGLLVYKHQQGVRGEVERKLSTTRPSLQKKVKFSFFSCIKQNTHTHTQFTIYIYDPLSKGYSQVLTSSRYNKLCLC